MSKKVAVNWAHGGSETYENVEKVEEERDSNDSVTGWRLYDAKGELIAFVSRRSVSILEVK